MALTTINRPDSQKALFGTGNDLEIYHDGTNSTIVNTTGELIIRDDSRVRIRTDELVINSGDNSESIIYAAKDGAVQLYYNNSKKFETTDVGVTATGHIFSTTKFRGNDDVKVSLGTSEDLQLYHDGSDSWIRDAGTGNLNIDASTIQLRKYGAAETMAKFIEDGAVELYYNNGKTFETTSAGATITPDLTVNGSGDTALRLANSGTNKWSIYNNSSGHQLQIFDNNGSAAAAKFNTNGSVELYYDGSKKLSTDTGGIIVDDDVKYMAGNSADLRIYHSGDWNYIQSHNSKNFALQVKDTENALIAIPDGEVQLFHNNNKVFETNGAGATIYGTEGGDAEFNMYADEGDDNADKWRILAGQGGSWAVKNYAPGSWDTFIQATVDAGVQLHYDNSLKFESTADGVKFYGHLFTNDANRIKIGTGEDLQIYHSGTKSYIKDMGTGSLRVCSNDFRVYNADDDELMLRVEEDDAVTLYHNGNAKLSTTSSGCTVTGSVTETSDVALKTNIEPLNNVLNKIQQITGYKYQFKDTGHDSMGVTAQDVEKVFPELVHGEEGTKTLQYSGLIGALIESVKELSNKVAALEAK